MTGIPSNMDCVDQMKLDFFQSWHYVLAPVYLVQPFSPLCIGREY